MVGESKKKKVGIRILRFFRKRRIENVLLEGVTSTRPVHANPLENLPLPRRKITPI